MKTASSIVPAMICSAGLAGVACGGPTVNVAIEIGLTPESLSACGATPAQAAGVLAALQQAGAERAASEFACLGLEQACRDLAAIDAQMRADPLDPALVTQRSIAAQSLQAARTSVDQARSALRLVATTGLTAPQIEVLSRCIRQARMRAPVAFRAGDWAPGVRRRLEAALTAEQRALAGLESMPEGAADLLTTARADTAVVEAAQGVAANMAPCEAVFNSFQN